MLCTKRCVTMCGLPRLRQGMSQGNSCACMDAWTPSNSKRTGGMPLPVWSGVTGKRRAGLLPIWPSIKHFVVESIVDLGGIVVPSQRMRSRGSGLKYVMLPFLPCCCEQKSALRWYICCPSFRHDCAPNCLSSDCILWMYAVSDKPGFCGGKSTLLSALTGFLTFLTVLLEACPCDVLDKRPCSGDPSGAVDGSCRLICDIRKTKFAAKKNKLPKATRLQVMHLLTRRGCSGAVNVALTDGRLVATGDGNRWCVDMLVIILFFWKR